MDVVSLLLVARMYNFLGGYFFHPGYVPRGRVEGPFLLCLRMYGALLGSVLVGRSLIRLFFFSFRVLVVVVIPMRAVGALGLIVPQWFLKRKGVCVGSGQGLVSSESWQVSFDLPPGSSPVEGGSVGGPRLFLLTLRGPCCWRVVAWTDAISSPARLLPLAGAMVQVRWPVAL